MNKCRSTYQHVNAKLFIVQGQGRIQVGGYRGSPPPLDQWRLWFQGFFWAPIGAESSLGRTNLSPPPGQIHENAPVQGYLEQKTFQRRHRTELSQELFLHTGFLATLNCSFFPNSSYFILRLCSRQNIKFYRQNIVSKEYFGPWSSLKSYPLWVGLYDT